MKLSELINEATRAPIVLGTYELDESLMLTLTARIAVKKQPDNNGDIEVDDDEFVFDQVNGEVRKEMRALARKNRAEFGEIKVERTIGAVTITVPMKLSKRSDPKAIREGFIEIMQDHSFNKSRF